MTPFPSLQTASAEDVQREVEGVLTRSDAQNLQQSVSLFVSALVSRSLEESSFYTPSTLARLVHTQCMSHRSVQQENKCLNNIVS